MIVGASKLEVLVNELKEFGISENTIWDGCKRNRQGIISSWKHRPHPNDKRLKLIDYDSLPETTRSKLPAREELVRISQGENSATQAQQIIEFTKDLEQLHNENLNISDYHFFLKATLSQEKAEDLKNAAGWLRLLNRYRTSTQTRQIRFNTKAELRSAVVAKLLQGRHLYGFKVSNVSVLQRKELAWGNAFQTALEVNSNQPRVECERLAGQAALSTLVHENFKNNNRRVIGKLSEDEDQRLLLPSGKIDFSEWNARTLIYLFTNPGKANKYDFENLYRRYQHECKKNERQVEVEISAVKQFLCSDEVKIYLKRERSGWAEHDKMLPHVYGKRPEFSLSKGGYDGFQVDFSSKIDGKQLLLTVVAVFDYKSGAITGFDCGMVEDGKMVRTMYRNHLNLMKGRSYIEIESDRFSGNLAEETRSIFAKTCQYITQPTPNDPEGKAPNPKARYVERLIQELNRLAQNFPGWKGTNITSIDKSRKPNPDYRNGNYVEGYAESVKQIIDLVTIYNNDTYNRQRSRMAECLESLNPKAPIIAHETIAMLLNQSTTVKVTAGLIAFEVNRRTYEYEFAEFDQHVFKMMKGMKVKVYYDEADMTSVDIFGDNDEFIATLGKLKRVAKAKAEQTTDDLAELGRQVDRRRRTSERISRKSLEVEAEMYGIDISNLSIDDAYQNVLGARHSAGEALHISAQELFATALMTPDARQMQEFYGDRLIRVNGEAVPVAMTHQEAKTAEQKLRALDRKKFNSKNQNNSL